MGSLLFNVNFIACLVKTPQIHFRKSVERVRYGCTPCCIGCQVAMTQSPSRVHTERCSMLVAMSSDVALCVRVREAHVRMSRQLSDAEPFMKKVEIR